MIEEFEDVEGGKVLLVAGDQLASYNNSDELDSSISFSSWHLDLYYAIGSNGVGELAVADIGTLVKDVISGSDFRWYFEFTVPEGLQLGACFYLIITDASDYNQVVYISPKVKATSITDHTQKIRYRNSKNIQNYNYVGLPDFNNQFRLPIVKRAPVYPTNRTGYDISSGAFLPVRTTQGKTEEFITRWFDDETHTGFNSATIHNGFTIFVDGDFKIYERGEDSEYSLEWIDNYPTAEGVIRLQRKDKYISSDAR